MTKKMKKVIFITLFGALILVSCNNNAVSKINDENLVKAKERDLKIDTEVPVMTFDVRDHDFGVINEGDVVETVFSFTNTGKTDLLITNAYATCGCTIPEWPKQPVKPGETGIIKVKFNSLGKQNKQLKTVTLDTNTKSAKEILNITAQVTPKKK